LLQPENHKPVSSVLHFLEQSTAEFSPRHNIWFALAVVFFLGMPAPAGHGKTVTRCLLRAPGQAKFASPFISLPVGRARSTRPPILHTRVERHLLSGGSGNFVNVFERRGVNVQTLQECRAEPCVLGLQRSQIAGCSTENISPHNTRCTSALVWWGNFKALRAGQRLRDGESIIRLAPGCAQALAKAPRARSLL